MTVHPYDGGSDVTADSGDFHVSLKPISDPGKPDDGMIDDSNSAATFTGTFRLTGYYAVPLIATVTYYYKDSGKYYGTYSGSDFVGDIQDNPDYDPAADTSGTSAAAPVMMSNSAAGQPQAPAGAPAPAPKLQKRVPSGLLAKLPDPVKLGLYSKNHATESYTIPVVPKSLFGDVKFDIPSGVASIAFKPETTTNAKGQTVNTGNLILTFTAVKPTSPTSPLPGDAVVATRASTGKNVGGATVLVLTPKYCSESKGYDYHYTNFVTPDPPNMKYSTNVVCSVAIVVEDQFKRPLDAIYDDQSVIYEVLSGDVSGAGYITDGVPGPSGQNGPGLFNGGSIDDPSGIPTASATAPDQGESFNNDWVNQKSKLPGKNSGSWNNAYAIAANATKSGVITETIHQQLYYGGPSGVALSPIWTRTKKISPANLPDPVFVVTESTP